MTTTHTITGSFDKAYSFFREKIEAAGQGEKLPSIREVARDCGVSKVVVGRVLTRLQAEGLLESRPRSGLFRPDSAKPVQKVVDFLFFGYPENLQKEGFHSEMISSLVARLAPESRLLRMHIMRSETDPHGVMEQVLRHPGAEVITSSIRMQDLVFLQGLNRAGVPCLHLLPNFVEPITPALTLHDVNLVRQQLDLLKQLGHRRIAYLHAAREDEFSRPINVRRDAFYRLAVEYGLELEPGWVRFVGWDMNKVRTELHDILAAEKKPTALIIYDVYVNPVYAELRACGLTPGRDISVLGMDDMPWAEHVDPPLTSVRISRPRLVEMALEMMEEIRAGKNPGTRYVEGTVMARQSTRAIA